MKEVVKKKETRQSYKVERSPVIFETSLEEFVFFCTSLSIGRHIGLREVDLGVVEVRGMSKRLDG